MIAIAYAGFILLALLLEAAFGWGDGQAARRTWNVALGASGFAIAATVAALFPRRHAALLDMSGWTSPGAVAAAMALQLVAYDLLYWTWHWSQHNVPALWTIHRTHHEDSSFDATTYLRQHPLEGSMQFLLLVTPLSFVIKLPMAAALPMGFAYAALDFWNHLGVRVSLGPFTRIISGPQLHRHHHAIDPSLGRGNYASFIPAWDIAFGTYVHPAKGCFPEVGLWDAQKEEEDRSGRGIRPPATMRRGGSPSGIRTRVSALKGLRPNR